MFKRNKLALIVFALLLLVAIFYFLSTKKATLDVHDTDFIIQDTSVVDKIKVDNPGSSFFLSKIDGYWYYNDSLLANPAMMKICFKILRQVQIQSVISKDKVIAVAENIKKNGSFVVVSGNNRPLKQFWIFADSVSHQIFMLMNNSKKPYLVNLPSFQGNFAGVFKNNRRIWRDKALLKGSLQDITNIKVENIAASNKSFEISVTSPANYTLKQLYSGAVLPYKAEAIEAYLLCFKYLNVEMYLEKSDSVVKVLNKKQPLFRIQILDKGGRNLKLETYPVEKQDKSLSISKGVDLNYCYLLLNNKEVAIIKYVEIDAITRDIDIFLK
jgi:hypothetical protein